MLIPAMMVTLTQNQEGELPHPFNMEDKRVKNGFLLVICLAFPSS